MFFLPARIGTAALLTPDRPASSSNPPGASGCVLISFSDSILPRAGRSRESPAGAAQVTHLTRGHCGGGPSPVVTMLGWTHAEASILEPQNPPRRQFIT